MQSQGIPLQSFLAAIVQEIAQFLRFDSSNFPIIMQILNFPSYFLYQLKFLNSNFTCASSDAQVSFFFKEMDEKYM